MTKTSATLQILGSIAAVIVGRLMRALIVEDERKVAAALREALEVDDVHITRLRRKLEVNQSSELIHTVRGVGFILGEETHLRRTTPE